MERCASFLANLDKLCFDDEEEEMERETLPFLNVMDSDSDSETETEMEEKKQPRRRLKVSKPIERRQYIIFHPPPLKRYKKPLTRRKLQMKRLIELHRRNRPFFDPRDY